MVICSGGGAKEMIFTEYEGLDFSYLKSILFQNWYRKEIVKTLMQFCKTEDQKRRNTNVENCQYWI